MNENNRWTEVKFRHIDAELGATLAFENGAKGTVIISDTEFIAYVEGSFSDLIEALTAAGCEVLSNSAVKQENWAALCPELTVPLVAGGYTIQPVVGLKESNLSPPAPREIRIIPGLGFGTGHHTATRLAFELIQTLPITPHKRALDLGTGSGILAFLISKHWKIPVDAIDNDELAIGNAIENASLNELPSAVMLNTAEIGALPHRYDLIAANLYAELLMALESQITKRLLPGGVLVVSGIMESLAVQLMEHYQDRGWRFLTTRIENGWMGAILQRAE